MPRILILSTTTGYQLRSFGDAAAELGIELMFGTDRCHALDDPWRDSAVSVRFHKERASIDAIVAAARERPIDGVIAVGDRPVFLAARIAAVLGLPGNPPEAALASAHKRIARECFARAGLPAPWFVPASLDQAIEPLLETVSYPAVIKPVALSGSRGVIRVNTPSELEAAFERVARLMARPEIRAQRAVSDRELVIEEFIAGREFAVEGLLTHGVFRPLALFDKPDPLDGPFFEETIYVTRDFGAMASTAAPAARGRVERGRAGEQAQASGAASARAGLEHPDAARILDAVARAARALGLSHGPIHAECRVNVDGVFVLEVAARPIGGLCSRVLRFATGGDQTASTGGTLSAASRPMSLEHLLLRHAAGEDISPVERESLAAAVMMIPIPRRGVFKGVRGEEAARDVPFVEDVRITAKTDQLLEPLPEAGSYLGFIFARAPHASDAEYAVRTAHRQLRFQVDPAIDVSRV